MTRLNPGTEYILANYIHARLSHRTDYIARDECLRRAYRIIGKVIGWLRAK